MLCYVCHCYLKLVLRYKFLIFNIYNPDTSYLREQGCEDPWLFCEAKRGPRPKMFLNHWSTLLETTPCYSCLDNTHNKTVREVAATVRLCTFLSLIYSRSLNTLTHNRIKSCRKALHCTLHVTECVATTDTVLVIGLCFSPLQSVQI
jgi:hypothetical protein